MKKKFVTMAVLLVLMCILLLGCTKVVKETVIVKETVVVKEVVTSTPEPTSTPTTTPVVIKETVIVEKVVEKVVVVTATYKPTNTPEPTISTKPNGESSTDRTLLVHFEGDYEVAIGGLWSAVELECELHDGSIYPERVLLNKGPSMYLVPPGTTRVGLWIGPELGSSDWWSDWDCQPAKIINREVTLRIISRGGKEPTPTCQGRDCITPTPTYRGRTPVPTPWGTEPVAPTNTPRSTVAPTPTGSPPERTPTRVPLTIRSTCR